MSQHLYPCRRCGVHGIAHYVLVPTLPGDSVPYDNVLLCTGCWERLPVEAERRAWVSEVRSSIGRAPVSKTGG